MTLFLLLGVGVLIGFAFGIIIDVDSFSNKFFKMLTHGKDPHRAE